MLARNGREDQKDNFIKNDDTGQTAIVTAVSSGIGDKLEKRLAKDCGTLIFVARDQSRLLKVIIGLERINHTSVKTIVKYLMRPGSAEDICHPSRDEDIKMENLVNSEGIESFGKFAESERQKEAQMISRTIAILTHLTILFVKDMDDRTNGKIMNVASTTAFRPGHLLTVG